MITTYKHNIFVFCVQRNHFVNSSLKRKLLKFSFEVYIFGYTYINQISELAKSVINLAMNRLHVHCI